MAANSNQNNPNQGEIDFFTLLEKLGELIKRAFLGLINLIGSILAFLLRKWYYFAAAILLTILSAFILNKVTLPYYQSDMVVRANATSNQPIMTSLDRLDDYASSKNFPSLAQELGLERDVAKSIRALETYWYYDIGKDGILDGIDENRKFLSDTSVAKIDSLFVVRAEVRNPDILQSLEEALFQYLESNKVLKAINKQRLSDLNAQLMQIEYEVEKLDSLQKREYYTNTDDLRQQEGQVVFTNEREVQMYHPQMFRLLQLKQECERELNIFNDVVTIVEGFSQPNFPKFNAIKYGKRLIWYYLGLALLLSVVITFRKKIWTR
jgi:hypothetical protein